MNPATRGLWPRFARNKMRKIDTKLMYNNILVIRDSQVLAKLGVVTIFFIGWGGGGYN